MFSVRVVALMTVTILSFVLFCSAARASGLSDSDVAPFEQRLNSRYPLSEAQLQQLGALIKAHPDEAYLHYLLARHQRRLGYTQLSDETVSAAHSRADTSGFFKKLMERHVANADIEQALNVMKYANHWHGNSDVGIALIAFYFNEQGLSTADTGKQADWRQKVSVEVGRLLARKDSWPAGVGGVLAHIAYTQGQYAKAVEYADIDLRKDPHLQLANQAKGLSLVRQGNMQAALQPLAEIFAVNPENGRTTPSYTQALIACGQERKALSPALYSLTQASDAEQLKCFEKRLARLLARLDQPYADATISDVTRKASWTSQRYTFYFALAETYEQMRRPELALRYYALASSYNKTPTTALSRMGKLHQSAGRYKEAHECYALSALADRQNVTAVLSFNRISDRMANRNNDIAWQLRDWLRRTFCKSSISGQYGAQFARRS